jgi:hypothetical protein
MVTCTHQGPAKPTMTAANVLVMGAAVALPAPYVVTLCTLPPPPAANGPCLTAPTWFNVAKRVFANGAPVLLQDSQALCTPSGTPLIISANQTRVFGT